MRLQDTIALYATGTSEGAKKGWESRNEGYKELQAKYPDMHEKLLSAQTPQDLSKITKQYNKDLDNNQEPMPPGYFKAMRDEHRERISESTVKMDTRTPQERQADRINTYLKQTFIGPIKR